MVLELESFSVSINAATVQNMPRFVKKFLNTENIYILAQKWIFAYKINLVFVMQRFYFMLNG
jgi:hypothetical protein